MHLEEQSAACRTLHFYLVHTRQLKRYCERMHQSWCEHFNFLKRDLDHLGLSADDEGLADRLNNRDEGAWLHVLSNVMDKLGLCRDLAATKEFMEALAKDDQTAWAKLLAAAPAVHRRMLSGD